MMNEYSNRPLPLMLSHLTLCPHTKSFICDEKLFEKSFFDKKLGLNIAEGGIPLYAGLSKTPPTATVTPGKMLPGGYTKSGKYKMARWSPGKTDKRAGK